MNRADLDKYQDIVISIRVKETTVVTDSVQASSAEYPYTSHSATIHGIARPEIEKLEHRKAALDAYIDGTTDVRAQLLMDLYYRKGMNWNQISAKTGRTQKSEEEYLYKFFKKNQ